MFRREEGNEKAETKSDAKEGKVAQQEKERVD